MLVVCMIFPIVPVLAFAEDSSVGETHSHAVTFKLEKVSETADSVKLRFSLAEGKLLCFDATFEADETLTCTELTASQEIQDFNGQNLFGVISLNPETGKYSFANTVEISAPMALADITYSKSELKGIELSDISLTIDTCYVPDVETGECAADVTVVNALPTEHTHTATGDWVTVTPSTCQAEGEKVKYCSECGLVAERESIEKAAHDIAANTVPATCEEDGYTIEYCRVCNLEISKTVLPKTNHSNTKTEHKDATCTEDGYDRVVCADCGKVLSEAVIKAAGHDVTVDEKPATCTEDGYRKEYCKTCNEVIKDEVLKAPGHKIVVEDKAPTCDEDGYHKETCSVCNEVLVNTVLPATNHSNTKNEHKDATCTEDGYDRVVCADCGKILSETVIEAKGHDIVVDEKAATCTEDGYHKETCSVCKEVLKDEVLKATGHLHKRTDSLSATCTEAGYIREYCTDCGALLKETILEAKGHKFVKDVKQATCTEDGYLRHKCSVCGIYSGVEVITKATGHAWSAWKVIKEPTYRSVGIRRTSCSACGEYRDEEIPMIVVPVEKIVIVPEEDFKIHCKKTDRLQATVFPEEAAYSAEIVWTSSNPKVVEVSEDGTIVAKSSGTATITASTKDGKVTATRNVTVDYSLLQWIIVYLLFGWIWYL